MIRSCFGSDISSVVASPTCETWRITGLVLPISASWATMSVLWTETSLPARG
ncbi:MAG TPA: hypothetical protein VNH11_35005 [Pirellulales bacterium]|nr:hypothetical protein [Pirellulales bacterium]